MVKALDIIASREKFRIPKVWEGKKWFTNEIREAAARRNEVYRKAMYNVRNKIGCNLK